MVSFTKSCDIATGALALRGVPYTRQAGSPGSAAEIRIGSSAPIVSYAGSAPDAKERGPAFTKARSATASAPPGIR